MEGDPVPSSPKPMTENVWTKGDYRSWNNKPDGPFVPEYDENKKLKLFELEARVLTPPEKAKLSISSLATYFQEAIPGAVDAIQEKRDRVFSVSFFSEKAREFFHSHSTNISRTHVKFERFPPLPEDAPFHQTAPRVYATRMRLLKVPLEVKREEFDKALAQIPGYIKGSASFETLAKFRNIRNGNLQFFVSGKREGIPACFLNVDGVDCEIVNPTLPFTDGREVRVYLTDKEIPPPTPISPVTAPKSPIGQTATPITPKESTQNPQNPQNPSNSSSSSHSAPSSSSSQTPTPSADNGEKKKGKKSGKAENPQQNLESQPPTQINTPVKEKSTKRSAEFSPESQPPRKVTVIPPKPLLTLPLLKPHIPTIGWETTPEQQALTV